jgi:hypothetical protein
LITTNSKFIYGADLGCHSLVTCRCLQGADCASQANTRPQLTSNPYLAVSVLSHCSSYPNHQKS